MQVNRLITYSDRKKAFFLALHTLMLNRCFEIEYSTDYDQGMVHECNILLGWARRVWGGGTSRTGTVQFAYRPQDSPRSHHFALPACLSLSFSKTHFIVSVSCEPVVCLHSLSPLCKTLTDKASTGANLPSSALLAVPGLHSTTN